MSELQRHADEVIHRLNRRRKIHACYPCAKRKVRCNGGHPCSVCQKRGHPEICFFASPSSSQLSNPTHDQNALQPQVPPARDETRRDLEWPNATHVHTSNDTVSDGGSASTSETHRFVQSTLTRTAIGNLSGATYVQHALSPHTTQDDIRSGLGLGNVSASRTNDNRQLRDSIQRSRIDDLYPKRAEVLRFFQPFRTHVAPFYPIILSVDELELSIHKHLDDVERRESNSMHSASDGKLVANIALFLGVLAVGAQFADGPSQIRETQSQNLIERCDACLRHARYTANPSAEIVQTLILIGLQAQNAGRSDESWCLLGLTFRLAQSLGMEGQTESDQHFLWGSILWQDALLSLRYDRTPIYSKRLSPSHTHTGESNYFSCMHDVCNLTRAYLLCERSERCDAKATQQRITNLAIVKNSAAGFLQSIDRCTNVEQRLQFYALQMHTSFTTSEMCRPFFLKPATTPQPTETTNPELHHMGVSCLQRTVEAYLNMSQLSNLPLRSWSLTHEAFTAVCVLTLLKLRSTSESTDSLLYEFQLFLERELASEKTHEAATYSMLRRGRQLFKLLERSAQYPDLDSAGRSQQGPSKDKDEPHHNLTASQTLGPEEASNQQSSEFETLVDRFWESVPFSEPDGTLLSLFDPSFYHKFSADNASPDAHDLLMPDIDNNSWYK